MIADGAVDIGEHFVRRRGIDLECVSELMQELAFGRVDPSVGMTDRRGGVIREAPRFRRGELGHELGHRDVAVSRTRDYRFWRVQAEGPRGLDDTRRLVVVLQAVGEGGQRREGENGFGFVDSHRALRNGVNSMSYITEKRCEHTMQVPRGR